ncbi:PucR family transcriptional regulator [Nocardia stercoris]|uniref:PucR family transcriptional regulator n=1 Tax=Nocardia stercoris TaxID=2483361 RepID=A0A3M2LBU0_9NOCA|nr:helix-turn-helix domain-containing protein [Nocardia stercoris]RMI35019.1 PucR family transcriptional regulator [Nocardia stercoris]
MHFSELDITADFTGTTLQLDGSPASLPLRNTGVVASTLVEYFATCLAPCRTLPGELLRGDVTQVTRQFLAIVVDMLDRQTVPEADGLEEVSSSASRWAREGVPLETILRAYHEGMRIGLGLVTARARAEDHEELITVVDLVLELLEVITVAATTAYTAEARLVAREHHSVAQTLASTLLSGHGRSLPARQSAIPVADSYQVVAVSIPPHPDEQDPRVDGEVAARRKLRRVQSAVAKIFDPSTLTLLSPRGGTVLVPVPGRPAGPGSARKTVAGPALTADVLAELSEAAEVPLTAVVVTAVTADIPEAAERAHELVGLCAAARRPPGLYDPADLAFEYQLTRPGPAVDQLVAVLAPLDKHPELLDTLRTYLSNDLNRQLTARRLFVHPNTLDHRIRRIAQLTALDLTTTTGISYASVALLARDLNRRTA